MVFLCVLAAILVHLLIGSGVGAVLVYFHKRHEALCRLEHAYNDTRKDCWCKYESDDEQVLWSIARVFAYGAFILWPLSLVGWLVIVPFIYYIVRPVIKYIVKPGFALLIVKPINGIAKLYDRVETKGGDSGKVIKENIRLTALRAEEARIKLQEQKILDDADRKINMKVDAALDRAGKLIDRIDRREGYDGHED